LTWNICKGVMLRSDQREKHLCCPCFLNLFPGQGTIEQSGKAARERAMRGIGAHRIPHLGDQHAHARSRSRLAAHPAGRAARYMPCSHPDSFDPSQSRPEGARYVHGISPTSLDARKISVSSFRAKRKKKISRSESHLNIPRIRPCFRAFSKPFF
jgi:hypothetical protein